METPRSRKARIGQPICRWIPLITVHHQKKRMAEIGSGKIKILTVLSGVLFFSPEKTKNDQFWVIFWIVGTVRCGRLQEARKSS